MYILIKNIVRGKLKTNNMESTQTAQDILDLTEEPKTPNSDGVSFMDLSMDLSQFSLNLPF